MLRAILAFSLRQSGLVLLLALALVGTAWYRLPDMSIDVFPELNAPTVVIMTEAKGLAAEEVEIQISFPLETALQGLPGLRRTRSSSTSGLSIVWVDLEWGEDLYRARQLVNERLPQARSQMPEDVQPLVTPITSIAGEIMLISLSCPSGVTDERALRAFAEFELRNEILSVKGVAQVSAIGGELPEYQVLVDPSRLALFGLTIDDIVESASHAHSTASGGYLPHFDSQEIPIRQESRVANTSDLAQTLVHLQNGRPILLGEVAEVRLGAAPRRGTASEGGAPAVILSIQKSPGTNTLALTRALDERFRSLSSRLPEGAVLNTDVMRQSHFIDRSIDNVTRVLLEAVVIVLAILLLFLMNLRTTLITLTSIPISLAFGLLAMDWLELGLNVMTLGGLAVAIGVLVDDAIIDVENVFRRLRENGALEAAQRRPALEVIFSASNEIRPAMVFATVIIVMVFVPLLFLEGLEGRFFRPLALTYMVSVLASLLVALTVVPALCRFLLGGRALRSAHTREPALVRALKSAYAFTLTRVLKARILVLGLAFAATLLALSVASQFGSSFLPSFHEGTYTVFLFAPPGTSLQESDRLAREVERQLVQLEGVRSVSRRTGRAERDEHAEPVSSSEIEVTLADAADRFTVRSGIDRVLSNVPGITTQIGQPIEHRLSHVLSGTPAAIAISIYGEDLAQLRATAQRIAREIEAIPGARDVNAQREVLVTTLPIRYRRNALAAAGLTPEGAATQVRAAFQGEVVARINDGRRQYDLVVRYAEEARGTIEDLAEFPLTGQGGATVRLRDVAEVGPERASNLITREDARRKAVISLNVAEGANLGDLIQVVRAKVDPIAAEAGLAVHYGGQFEAQEAASKTILVSGIAVTLLMLLLLRAATGSLVASLLIMLNMPLAMIGGIAALVLAEGPAGVEWLATLLRAGPDATAPVLSIASLVGFITLFGIAVRNGILLVNHYQHVAAEAALTGEDPVLRGSLERLVPILMTAISSALGLLPLALAADKPGSELLAPLAVVTLGGLLSSTFLNLIVVPAGYALFCSGRHRPLPSTNS